MLRPGPGRREKSWTASAPGPLDRAAATEASSLKSMTAVRFWPVSCPSGRPGLGSRRTPHSQSTPGSPCKASAKAPGVISTKKGRGWPLHRAQCNSETGPQQSRVYHANLLFGIDFGRWGPVWTRLWFGSQRHVHQHSAPGALRRSSVKVPGAINTKKGRGRPAHRTRCNWQQ